MPVLFSGSLSVGSDVYNIDTPINDLRSYSGELLNSFDQFNSILPECEIISLIKTNNKIIIVFRMGNYDLFSIKIWDMFFDRKVFYNGSSTITNKNEYLNTEFLVNTLPMSVPTDALSFTRDQAKSAVQRNKDILKINGINIDLDYVIIGNDTDKNKSKKLLEIGVFDYDFNDYIQKDTIFVHKIYGITSTITTIPIISG